MTLPPTTPGRQRTVRANGLDLAVTEYATPERSAHGPALVLLHGIGSRAVSWWPVVDALAARFRVYALDLRGHGASAKPETGYLFPDYAADLQGLLDALGEERPLILGHSLGGLIALQWAVNHLDRAAGIALEDTALRSHPDILKAFDGWIALNAMPVEQAAVHYHAEYPDWTDEDCWRRAESITSVAPAVFVELRADTEVNLEAGTDRLALLDVIRSPVLLVYGDLEAGGMVVPEDAARFAATVPHARVERVPGAGHSIHRDRTEAFLDRVMPFWEEVG